MYEDRYEYRLQLIHNDGVLLLDESVTPDFEPLVESAYFGGIRRGVLPENHSVGTSVVEPIWHSEDGKPTVASVKASVVRSDKVLATGEAPNTYFCQLAQDLSAALVAEGKLKSGEVFSYKVKAQTNGSSVRARHGARAMRFEVDEVVPAFPVRGANSSILNRRSMASGIQVPGDMAVFVMPQVLDEIAAATRAADWKETGGLLLGHLCRDSRINDLVAIVTSQIPAEHTRCEATRLGFTPDTWAAMESALRQRATSEIRLGWWHCHSFWRESHKDCDKKEKCPLLPGFFSADDILVHRTVFPRAYSLGLLATYVPCGQLQHTLFGWRNGMVASRGFRILGHANEMTSKGEHE